MEEQTEGSNLQRRGPRLTSDKGAIAARELHCARLRVACASHLLLSLSLHRGISNQTARNI